MRHTGFLQRRLGDPVLVGEGDRRRVGMQDAGIGDERHARGLGGIDRVLVLGRALPDRVRRDQQQPIHAGQGRIEGGGLGVVRGADGDAFGGEVGQGLRPPRPGNDPVGWDGFQQFRQDEPAELAAGRGDEDLGAGLRHDGSLVSDRVMV
jgi:hypothetical protein